jgi:hypothetical protein
VTASLFESTGLAHSSLAPTSGRARESLPNTVVGNREIFISISIFFHRPLYVQVPPTTSLPRRRDLEKFFNFSDLENFSTFFFSTTSSLYRKVVDVPGSNCTKKSISEFLPDFHLSSGRAARSTAARSPPKTGLGNFRT